MILVCLPSGPDKHDEDDDLAAFRFRTGIACLRRIVGIVENLTSRRSARIAWPKTFTFEKQGQRCISADVIAAIILTPNRVQATQVRTRRLRCRRLETSATRLNVLPEKWRKPGSSCDQRVQSLGRPRAPNLSDIELADGGAPTGFQVEIDHTLNRRSHQ
jgi:hypothetical protein